MDDDRRTRPIFDEYAAPVKTRVLLLILAGILILGGTFIWIMALEHKLEPVATLPLPGAQPERALPGRNGEYPRPLAPAHLMNGAGPDKPAPQAGRQSLSSSLPAGMLAKLQAKPAAVNGMANDQAAGQKALSDAVASQLPARPANPNGMANDQAAGQKALSNAVPPQADSQSGVAKSIPATPRMMAVMDARTGAGRRDPYAPNLSYKPYPRVREKEQPENAGDKSEPKQLKQAASRFVPPPPPGVSLPSADQLSVAELPAPPAKPSIVDKMKLLAIVGDRAIISFDRLAARDNHWPKTLSLGPGEQFESVSIVGVNKDAVTLEEDGERSVIKLAGIK